MSRSRAKALSVLLSIALVLSSIPAPAIAEMAEEVMGVESATAPTTSQPSPTAPQSSASGGSGVESNLASGEPAPSASDGTVGDSTPAAPATPQEPTADTDADPAPTEPRDTPADTTDTPAPAAPQEPTAGTTDAPAPGDTTTSGQQPQPAPQQTPAPGTESERTVSATPARASANKPEGATNDELFAAYAQRLIDESVPGRQAEEEVSLGTQSAADGLTGANLVCYNKLKALVRSVAAGDVTQAATTVRCSELGAESYGPWTAEDLGVPSVDVDGYVPADAFAKVRERLGVDTRAIFNALRADCPYDLYWFDATAQDAFATGMVDIKVRMVGGKDAIDVTGATLTFELRVAQEYRPVGSTKKTEVDPSKIAAVKSAVTRAKGIAFDPNKAGMSVRDRLAAYKDAICSAVSYNHDAADDDDMPYGNPWQLVWVFDGDPTTNVVCEGYAKAFKYLCDLTWPNREGGVECLLVTGKMTGGTGTGNHMWNVVRMDDGRNYLVDPTNCDEGTVGAPDKLFLAYGPSGSYDAGYTFALDNTHSITYAYDAETKAAFDQDALTISEWPYSSPGQPLAVEPPTVATDLVYDGREQAGVADSVWYALSGTTAATDTGDYTATATLAQGCKWSDGTTGPKTVYWSIARRPVTVTADFKTKVAGQADPELTATVEGTLNGDAVNYALYREPGEYVGGYAITPTGQATQGNYSVTFLPGKLTICESETTVLCSGTWGTCPWEITDDGTLTVYPGVGEDQTGDCLSPWADHADLIIAVCLESQGSSRVVLPACSRGLFSGLPRVTSMNLSGADASRVEDASFMFAHCPALASLDLSGWDTSRVTDMYAMFNVCYDLTSLNLFGWNTSNVTDMGYLFSGCRSLTSLDLSGWDTSNVTNMAFMFYNCQKLSSLNVSGFDTSQVTNMNRTFGCCSSLASIDVSQWNTSRVTDMHGLFYDCSSLTSLSVSGWDTSRVTDMSFMFHGCSSLESLNVSGLNTQNVTDMGSMFGNCSALAALDLSGWATRNVTDMGSMFYNCSSLTTLTLTDWDTSKATTMRHMFSGCSSLSTLDVSGFVTSNVTDMGFMFYNCSSLAALNISDWDTSNVTDMSSMFWHCSSLTSISLTGWDTSKVTDMGSMFSSCSALEELDLSGFSTSRVKDMRSMFQYCSRLATLNISGFDTSFVSNLSWMFYNCMSLSEIRVGTGVRANLLTEFPSFMVYGTRDWYSESLGRIILRSELVLRVGVADTYSKGQNAPVDIGGMTVDLTGVWAMWDGTEHRPTPTVRYGDTVLTQGTDYYLTYSDNVDAGTATVTAHGRGAYSGTCSGRFEIVRRPVTVTADTKIKTYGTEDPALTATVEGTLGGDTISYTVSRESGEQTGVYAVTPSGEALQGNYAVTFVPGWLTIRGESSDAIFVGRWGTCDWEVTEDGTLTVHQGEGARQPSLTSPWASYKDKITSVVFDGGDGGKVKFPDDSDGLFSGLDKVTTIDFSGADTSNATSMVYMFNGCSKLASLDLSGFVTSNVTDMTGMFGFCSKLASLDLSGFNTSKVTDMGCMFWNCPSLASLDVSGWDTSKVTDMHCMFESCPSLVSVDVSGWETLNVTDMHMLFYRCPSLASLDVSRWNTSNVTSMLSMFSGCPSLASLDVSRWNTSNVTDMGSMFHGCSSLASLDVSRWNTSKVADMGYMFCNCSSLTSLQVSDFVTSSVTDMGGMFFGCSKLASLDVSRFDTSKVTDMHHMFSGCSSLSSLQVSGFVTSSVTDMQWMFYGCSSLSSLDLSGWSTSSVADMNHMFSGCSSLSSLDLSGWSTSSVTKMGYMFHGCTTLSSLDLSRWNTSSVADMSNMFEACSSLSSLDLSGWSTSSVTDMSSMFYGCSSLSSLGLSGWDTSSANVGLIFGFCPSLSQIRVGSGVGSNLLGAFPGYNLINGTYDWYSADLGRIVTKTELAGRAGIADVYSKMQNVGDTDISRATVSLTGVSEVWDGTEHRPTPEVRLDGRTLTQGNDYYLTYSNNVAAGTATVTAHGWGGYRGSCSGTFQIAHRPVTVTADDKEKKVGEGDPALTATVEGTLGGDSVTYELHRKSGETPGTYVITPSGQETQGNYAVTFVPGRFTIRTSSQTVLYSGTWGTCSWEIGNDGTLAVYPGVGESQENKWSSPWDAYRSSIRSVRLVALGGSKVILPEHSQYLFSSLYNASSIDLSGANASRVTDMSYMFYYCPSLTTLDLSGLNTSRVTNMSGLFSYSYSLASLDLSRLNTSRVTNMAWMFDGCSSLTDLDLSGFDTSQVTDMTNMFYYCTSLSSLNVSGWNTSGVTSMGGMFCGCSSLSSLDLRDWDTSSATSMGSMFYNCSSLATLDLSGFNTSQVTYMGSMFESCSSLTDLDLSGWNTSGVTDMSWMFNGCSSLSQIKVGDGAGSNLLGAFPTYEINGISGWRSEALGQVLSAGELPARAGIPDTYSKQQGSGGTYIGAATIDPITGWEVYDGTAHTPSPTVRLGDRVLMPGTDYYLTYENNVDAGTATVVVHGLGDYSGTCSGTFEIMRKSVTVRADDKYKIQGEDDPRFTATVEGTVGGDTVTYELYRETGETPGTYAISPYGQAEQGNYRVTFCSGTLTIRDAASAVLYSGTWGTCQWRIDVDGVLTVRPGEGASQESSWSSPWYNYSSSIRSVRLVAQGGSRVTLPTNCQYLFGSLYNASSIDLSGADASQVTSASNMFYNCASLGTLDLSGLDTPNLTDTSHMFYYCSSLRTLDLTGFDTSEVKDMYGMFDSCTSLTSLGLSHLDTQQVSDMSYMFYNCSSLRTLDLTGFDTSRASSVYGPFTGCTALREVKVGSGVGSNLLRVFPFYQVNGTYDWESERLGRIVGQEELSGRAGIADTYRKPPEVNLALASIGMQGAPEVYDGTERTPLPTVWIGDKTLTLGTDYTLTYENNVNAGTATVIAHGLGAYIGTVSCTFQISKAPGTLSARADKATVDCARGTTTAWSNVAATGALGQLSYTNVSMDAVPKGFVVDSRTGRLFVPAKTPAGTYQVRVSVSDSGDANHEAATKYVTYKVRATFPDVASNAWYAGMVWRAAELGLISGYNDGRFGPEDKITRGQVAVILWNMKGKPGVGATPRVFPDVKTDDYFYNAVRWASSVGVVSGYESGSFGPNDDVTREQLAAMLANYAKNVSGKRVSGSAGDYASMKDKAKVSHWAELAIGWCFRNKILSGTADGRVNPQGNATRAEAAKMIVGLYNLIG